ncbi:MAG: NUDIX hydrolase [Candidatus Saccharibacteria bacterium]
MKLHRSAKVVILDKDNNALVLRRSSTHPNAAYHSDLPGGVTEGSETFEVGLSREIKEEVGLTIAPESLKLIYTFNRRFFTSSVSRLVYAVRVPEANPTITLSYEHVDFTWQPIADVKDIERPYQKGIDYANKHNLWSKI